MRRKWPLVIVALLAVFIPIDLFLDIGKGPAGYYAFLGLLGSLAVIIVSVSLGRSLLQRREDYYGRHDDDE